MTGSRTNEKALGKEVNQMQEIIGKLKKAGSKEICIVEAKQHVSGSHCL